MQKQFEDLDQCTFSPQINKKDSKRRNPEEFYNEMISYKQQTEEKVLKMFEEEQKKSVLLSRT